MPKLEPSVLEETDADAEERAMRDAEADLAADRVISHEAMTRWLRSWGKPDELPPPECGE